MVAGSEVSTKLDPALTCARAARAFVTETLGTWGLQRLTDIAQLLTSELVTNAVRHARSEDVDVTMRHQDEAVRVEVHDTSSEHPVPKDVSPEAESGRGLHLVAALSKSWGVKPAESGKAVWFELSTNDGP